MTTTPTPSPAPVAELNDEQIDKMVDAWFTVPDDPTDYRARMRQALGAIESPAVVDGSAPILRKLVEQIDKAVFVDENGHPLKMNAAYLAAKEAL